MLHDLANDGGLHSYGQLTKSDGDIKNGRQKPAA